MISLAWILGGQCPPSLKVGGGGGGGGGSAPPAPPVPPPMSVVL